MVRPFKFRIPRKSYKPPIFQPTRLQEILFSRLSQHIIDNLPSTDEQRNQIQLNKENESPSIYGQLPGSIASRLLQRLQKWQSGNQQLLDVTLTIYFLGLFLGERFQDLTLLIPERKKSNEFSELLEIVARKCKNLKSFRLIQDYTPQDVILRLGSDDINHLTTVLKSEYLVYLDLQLIVTEDILTIIGEQCAQLKRLRIPSAMVSDYGLHYLTQRIVEAPHDFDENENNWCSTMWQLPQLFPTARKLWPSKFANHTEEVKYKRIKNALCKTLTEVDLTGIMVSNNALLSLFELVPNLQSIGYRLDPDFFKHLRSAWKHSGNLAKELPMPTLKVERLLLENISEDILPVIKQVCPHVVSMRCILPVKAPLSCLNGFENLRYLHCEQNKKEVRRIRHAGENSIPSQHNELMAFMEKTGRTLKTLKLRYKLLTELNLYTVFKKCPWLEELTLLLRCSVSVSWVGENRFNLSWWPLKKVVLRACVLASAVISLIETALNLSEIHVKCIWDKKTEAVLKIRDTLQTHLHVKQFFVEGSELFTSPVYARILLRSDSLHHALHVHTSTLPLLDSDDDDDGIRGFVFGPPLP